MRTRRLETLPRFDDGEELTPQQIRHRAELLIQAMEKSTMHYRNGREAKNGDRIVQIGVVNNQAVITSVGVLYDAKPGNDYCNGSIAPIQQAITGACLCDCLHIEDVAALLAEKGFDKRPAGK